MLDDPAYERAGRAGTRQRFPQAAPAEASAATQQAEAIAWRDYFADARLREVIALALQNNRDLRVAALNIEARGRSTASSVPTCFRPSPPAAGRARSACRAT